MFSNTFKDKKVLITGNTGFKGSWLSAWLIGLEADVYGISKDIPTNPSMFEVLNLEEKITHFNCDIRDYDTIKKFFKISSQILFFIWLHNQ